MKRKLVVMTLAILMSASQVVGVSADYEQDLIEEQAWTGYLLNNTYAEISQLWYQKSLLENQIAALDSNLVDVMVSIDVLKKDISDKEAEISATQDSLDKAVNARDKQYEAMKKRIQYLYEKGGTEAWFQMMMEAEDLTDLLTKAEYTEQMYQYDRDSLDVYVNTVDQVKLLEEKYASEKAELEGMETELEGEQANLEAQLAATRAASANCSDEIAWAQNLATEYENLIYAYQVKIDTLEAERIAAAEARAREEAEWQAYLEANGLMEDEDGDLVQIGYVEYQSESAVDYVYDEDGDIVYDVQTDDEGNTVYDEDGDPVYVPQTTEESGTSSYTESTSSSYDYDEYGNVIDTDNTVSTQSYSKPSYSGSGSSVVDYATQFVGNPYVWGGTSLTNGADCSGFVQSVYSNFGVSLPRTSYEQQNAGYEVSYADAQPGDLICYGGHVAIYMGNGQIVHASNARDGIKISNNAAYRTILSVRRLV